MSSDPLLTVFHDLKMTGKAMQESVDTKPDTFDFNEKGLQPQLKRSSAHSPVPATPTFNLIESNQFWKIV